ncbi:hypothetical protein DFS33DRAFT_1248381 [Desarmillaria ectypa]|nr:hypothetical protein DFS33DRAFT_1248381 [Desarmillaria ectypa]
MYDRTVKPVPEPTATALRYRIETLVSVNGVKMAKHQNLLRLYPQLSGVLLFEGVLFGFGIGINVTDIVFLGFSPRTGFGWSKDALVGAYGTAIVGTSLPDSQFTTGPIIVLPRYICGLVTLGASLHLSPRDVIMSWDFADLAIMINTVAIYTYRNDCFPKHQGEVGTFINLMRTRGGT